MKYEKIYECEDALDKGKLENVTIVNYVKDGIIRECGSEFYNNLKND